MIYLIGAGSDVPAFVYGIFVSLFMLFIASPSTNGCSAACGRWSDYLHGERVYIWLSLIAKSLLAWQMFANNSSSADLITSRPGSTTRRALPARERIAFEQIQQLSY